MNKEPDPTQLTQHMKRKEKAQINKKLKAVIASGLYQ